MNKKYRVTLTDDEREELESVIRRRSEKSAQVRRAYVLLAADEKGEKCWSDARICETYTVGIRTVERLRRRFVEDGSEVALWGKKREIFKEKVLDGKTEARLIALRCGEPPPGFARWTLRLLSDKMVELSYAEHISHESVRQILKKMN